MTEDAVQRRRGCRARIPQSQSQSPVEAGVCRRCDRRGRMGGGSRRGRSAPAGTAAFSLGRNVARQLRASDRVYPRNLHAILQGRWDSAPLFDGFPPVELPPKAVLDELLDVCFQASMLTEEGRPTVFRVAYIPSAAPVTPNRAQL